MVNFSLLVIHQVDFFLLVIKLKLSWLFIQLVPLLGIRLPELRNLVKLLLVIGRIFNRLLEIRLMGTLLIDNSLLVIQRLISFVDIFPLELPLLVILLVNQGIVILLLVIKRLNIQLLNIRVLEIRLLFQPELDMMILFLALQ